MGLVFLGQLPSSFAQFPIECVPVQPGGQCCPTLGPEGLVCGGPTRGACLPFSADGGYTINTSWFPFENVCVCRGNFAGARCDMCRPGFLLPDCVRTAQPRVRKDWAKLPEQERQDVMAAFNSMKVSGTYLRYATEGGLPLSDYDAFTYMHSRSVYNLSLGCTEDCSYAHLGPGFATWHRRLLIFFETIFLDYLPVESSVTGLPFLNWTILQSVHDIFTPQYFGSDTGNASSVPPYQISNGQFALWRDLAGNGSVLATGIKRNYNVDAEPYMSSWSYIREIAQFDEYAAYPWSSPCSNMSFVNRLEGNRPDPTRGMCRFDSMHNVFHFLVGGDMDYVPLAANDPIFFLHHCFVDLVFEMWLQAHPGVQAGYYRPMTGGPPGHSGIDCTAPIFPCVANAEMFANSSHLGYTYEFLSAASPDSPAQGPSTSSSLSIADWTAISLAAAIVLAIVCAILIRRRLVRWAAGYSGLSL